jgi:hypothetical protein
MTIPDFNPYAPRPITPLAPLAHGRWHCKVYGIALQGTPRRELESAARKVAVHALDAIPPDRGYGAGFVGVHDGRGEAWVFLDWWEQENELHHRVWTAPTEQPADLRPQPSDGAIACVWDLAVLAHERSSWVRHVLQPAVPDITAYLADHLDAVL